MSSGVSLVSRRTTMAVTGVGMALLTGCDSLRPQADAPAGSPTPEADPDAALVDTVRTELTAAVHATARAGRTRLEALHRAHLTALDGDQPAAIDRADDRRGAAVRRLERRLQASLVEASLAARSGALARALAAMAAAVAQELAQEAALSPASDGGTT